MSLVKCHHVKWKSKTKKEKKNMTLGTRTFVCFTVKEGNKQSMRQFDSYKWQHVHKIHLTQHMSCTQSI